MKKDEEKSDKGGGRLMFLLAAAAIAALGGVVGWYYRQRGEAETDFQRAKEDLARLKELGKKIASIKQRIGPGKKVVSPPDRPEDLVSFFTQKANAAGMPKVSLRPPDREIPWAGWREFPYAIETGRQENMVQRSSLVAFLEGVEKERPYLKTKSLNIKFGEQNTVSATATISFFKSETAR